MVTCSICRTKKEDTLSDKAWVGLFNRDEPTKYVCRACAYRIARKVIDEF